MYAIRTTITAALWLLTLSAAATISAAEPKDAVPTDADFSIQGEYAGEVGSGGDAQKIGVQVIALGQGKFRAVGYKGGLPGDGWSDGERHEVEAALAGGEVKFMSEEGVSATVKDGVLTIREPAGTTIGELKRVERKSPTLEAKPPAGAIVLFDGKGADAFEGGRVTEDGLLVQGATSKQKFQDCTVHVEFRLPYMPDKGSQGRGNSGVYLQGRYEVQVLDSFGLKGENNECGGIYSIRAPNLNMCYPPLAWQTYDIDYTAAKYENGKKSKNASMTVKHNGVVIHRDVEVPKATTAAPVAEGPEAGPLFLQDHGDPVCYRNVWVVEKK